MSERPDCIARAQRIADLCAEFPGLADGWQIRVHHDTDPLSPTYGRVTLVEAIAPTEPAPPLDPPEDPARDPEEPAVP